ncbi:MAG: hypothetical protein QOH34_330 [Mycobacterium sp.]|jgi:hypothetical protein|nr:hypothetical protein [Mycobacterium sp.]
MPVGLGHNAESQFEFTMTIRAIVPSLCCQDLWFAESSRGCMRCGVFPAPRLPLVVACLAQAPTDLECETQFSQFMRHAERTAASFLDSA